ncbi:TonB-dependent receptor family protein [Parvibaculum sp.]|uniref:TonB-dependent receptor family protein n=1 Tax=Parvibaculum sp. TaxID=2024848 RepID=UPI002CBA2101|nr:TonB-dependent receptor [Parvibaculum sp.]HUD50848.1 TonB-dependent receptor [Parvibaculum sp.]
MHAFFSRGLATAAALICTSALAEDASAPAATKAPVKEPLTMDRIVVTAKKTGTLTAPGIDEAIQQLSRVPGAVTVVDPDSFKDKYTANLEDAFAFTPGVFATKRYGQEVRLSIRGAGLSRSYHLRSIELLSNGVPLNLADGSGDFQEVDPATVQHIEVYRGGDGLQYGAASLGGAINIVSPTAYTAQAENLLRIEGGSFGTVRGHGEVARILGDTDFFASLTGLTSEGWRDHSKEKTARISANVGHKFNTDVETRFYLNANSVDQELPGTLTYSKAQSDPESASASALSGNQQRNTRTLRFANKTSFALDGDAKLDIGAYAGYYHLFHPIYQVLDQGATNLGAFTRYTDEGELFGHRDVVTVGARYGRTALTGNNYQNVKGSRGALLQESTQISTTAVLYAENAFYVVPDIAVVTGVQGLNAVRRYTTDVVSSGAHKKDDADFTSASPKLGLLWDVTPTTQAFANVTRSYEPPIMSDLTQSLGAGTQFTPMDPQRGLTYEAGTRGSEGPVTWDITAYRAEIRDELVNFTTSPSIPAATFNARKTLHQGVEASLALDIGALALEKLLPQDDRLTLEQVYTWSDFSFEDDAVYGDNKLAGTVPHVYAAALRYRSHRGWDIAPKIDWVPDGGYVDYANTFKAPGYVTFGIEGGVDVTEGLRIFADARNLADRRYISNYTTVTTYAPSQEDFYPGEGRSVFVGLTASF